MRPSEYSGLWPVRRATVLALGQVGSQERARGCAGVRGMHGGYFIQACLHLILLSTQWLPSDFWGWRVWVLTNSHVRELNFFSRLAYVWLRRIFAAVWGLSPVVVSRGRSSLQCVGLSLGGFSLQSTGSRHVGSGVAVCGLSLPHGMWDLSRSEIEPVSCTDRQILTRCTTKEVPEDF